MCNLFANFGEDPPNFHTILSIITLGSELKEEEEEEVMRQFLESFSKANPRLLFFPSPWDNSEA